MPKRYITSQDVMDVVNAGIEAGLSDKQIVSTSRKALRRLEEERRGEEIGDWGIPRQAAWAFLQRPYEAAGAVLSTGFGALGSLLLGKPSGARSPFEVVREMQEHPFSPRPPAPVTEQAPGVVKAVAPMAGSLARDLPLLGGMFGAMGKAASLGKAPLVGGGLAKGVARALPRGLHLAEQTVPRLTRVAKTAGAFEALGQLGGEPTGTGALSGAALSAGPALLSRSMRFAPKTLPTGMINPMALPRAVQAGGMGLGAVAGITAKDWLQGMPPGEQFDITTPEGRASLTSKALAFGFVALNAAKEAKRIAALGEQARARELAGSEEFFKGTVVPQGAAMRAAREAQAVQLTPERMQQKLNRMDDLGLERLAKTVKAKMPDNPFTPEETNLRSVTQSLDALNQRMPTRQIFTDTARETLLANINKEIPRNAPLLSASLAKEKAAGGILYRLVHSYSDEVPKSPLPKPKVPSIEGVYKDKAGKLSLRPVKVDMVTPEQRGAASQTYKAFYKDARTYQHVIDPARSLHAWRHRTLRNTIGVEKADFLYKQIATRKRAAGQLHDYLTGHEYNQFLRNLRGEASRMLRMLEVESFRQTGMIRNVRGMIQGRWEPPMPQEVTENTSVEQRVRDAGISHYFRQSGLRLLRHQDKNPGDPTGTLWYFTSEATSESLNLQDNVQRLIRWAWTEQLPTKVLSRKGEPVWNYVNHLRNTKSAKAMGVPQRSIEEVAKAIKWGGTPQQLEARVKTTAARLDRIYDWLFSMNGMSLSQFRDQYLPMWVKWHKGGMKEDLDVFAMRQGLSEVEAKSMTSLIRRLGTPPSAREVPTGKKPPYEYPRKIEQEVIEHLVYETNPITAMDKYARMLARRTIKEPLLPLVNDIVSTIRANHAGEPGGGKRILQSMKWYLESWWGSPSTLDRLVEGYHPMVRGYDWFRNHAPGMRKILPELTGKNYRGFGEFFDFMTTVGYGTTLGWNAKPVLKNMTQTSHTVAIMGLGRHIKNRMRYLSDPVFRKEVDALRGKIRYQYLDMPGETSSRLTQAAQRYLTKPGLMLFKAADTWNVSGACEDSKDCWSEAMATKREGKDVFLERLKLRRMRWMKYLWQRFRKLPGVEKEYRTTYRGAETLGDLIWKDVTKGDARSLERAQLQYTKFMTYLTQYAYGAPESAPAFRGSFNRFLFMYGSWPANYAEFLTAMARTSCGREWLRLVSYWLTFGGLMASMGSKAYQWVAAGPFPAEAALPSPPVRAAASAYKIANTVARASQGWILGAEDDWYLQNAEDRIIDALEEFEWLIPGRRLIQDLSGE